MGAEFGSPGHSDSESDALGFLPKKTIKAHPRHPLATHPHRAAQFMRYPSIQIRLEHNQQTIPSSSSRL